jgi:hypothetical protein
MGFVNVFSTGTGSPTGRWMVDLEGNGLSYSELFCESSEVITALFSQDHVTSPTRCLGTLVQGI